MMARFFGLACIAFAVLVCLGLPVVVAAYFALWAGALLHLVVGRRA